MFSLSSSRFLAVLLLSGALACAKSEPSGEGPDASKEGVDASKAGSDASSSRADASVASDASGPSDASTAVDASSSCSGTKVNCQGDCIDPQTDSIYCGAKGRCTSPTATDPDFQGVTCAGSETCQGGVCSGCGNGKKETGEDCDLGPQNGTGAGCSATCHFDCAVAADCDDKDLCNGVETCVDATVLGQAVKKCQGGTAAAKCTACATGVCDASGKCVASTCGDGCLDAAKEQCDLGAQNGTGVGCSATCHLDCAAAADCDDKNACNGAETCVDATVQGQAVKKCQGGTAAAKCTLCATGVCDAAGKCVTSTCGDGCLDATKEQCDLGAQNGTGAGCSATCHFDCTAAADCDDKDPCNGTESCVDATVQGQAVKKCQGGTAAAKCTVCATGVCDAAGKCVASTCGDGCLDASRGEQCDDGNLFDLDGCDSNCAYEVVIRLTSMSIESTPGPAFCTPTTNALGTKVITSAALDQLNGPLQDDFTQGNTNVLLPFLGLGDLTGVTDPGFSLGMLGGDPDPTKGTWPAAGNPLDWWFLGSYVGLSAGLPKVQTTGVLVGRNMSTGPDDLDLPILLAGSPANLKLRSSRIAATINGTPAPDVPAPPPAQLASGLTVFQTVTGSGTGQGMCGNITVESLSKVPVPAALTSGATACTSSCSGSHSYVDCGANPVGPGCNSLLDVIVGGCKVVYPVCVAAINATQPDVPAGGGPVKTLTLDSSNKVPDSQTTGNNDAYSSYLKFDANRVHLTGQTCLTTPDCQAGKTCTAGTCQ